MTDQDLKEIIKQSVQKDFEAGLLTNPQGLTYEQEKNVREMGEFRRGLARGTEQLKSAAYGFGAIFGDIIGAESVKESLIQKAQEKEQEAANYISTVPTTEDIVDSETLINYITGTIGELIPSITEAGVTALGGAALGTLVEPGGGTVVGGLLGKTIFKKALKELVDTQIKKGVAKEIAEKKAKKALLRSIGAKTGVVTGVAPIETGSNYLEGINRGFENPYSALATGTTAAFLELVGGNIRIINKILGPGSGQVLNNAIKNKNIKLVGKVVKEALIQAPGEFAQEAAQELLSLSNIALNDPEFEMFSEDNIKRIKEAGFKGLVGGTVFGGITGGVEAIVKPQTEIQKISDEKIAIDILKNDKKRKQVIDNIIKGETSKVNKIIDNIEKKPIKKDDLAEDIGIDLSFEEKVLEEDIEKIPIEDIQIDKDIKEPVIKAEDIGVEILPKNELVGKDFEIDKNKRGEILIKKFKKFNVDVPKSTQNIIEKGGAYNTKEAINDKILPIIKKWENAPIVKVVQSVPEMPKKLREQAVNLSKQEEITEALFDASNNEIYMIADNIVPDRIEKVLLHESIGHFGLREVMGKNFNSFLDELRTLKQKEIQENNPNLNFKDVDAVRSATEEWFARKVETDSLEASLWQKFIRGFKKFVRNLGINLKLSDNEVKAILLESKEAIEKNKLKVQKIVSEDIRPSVKPKEIIKTEKISKIEEEEISEYKQKNIAEGVPKLKISKESIKNMASKFYTLFVMREYPIVRLATKAGKDVSIAIENQIRRIRGRGGIVEDTIKGKGPSKIDGNGNVVYRKGSKALLDILQPLNTEDLQSDYEALRIAERDVALAIHRPEIKGTNRESSEKVIKLLEKKYGKDIKKLREISKQHRNFEHQAVLLPLLESGKLSKEKYDQIIKAPESEYYASFSRQLEGVEDAITDGAATKSIKATGISPLYTIKGSKRELKKIPSIEATISNVQRVVRFVELEKLNKSIVEMKNASTDLAESIVEIKADPRFQPKQTIRIHEDGKIKFFKLPADVHEAIQKTYYSANEMSVVAKILNIPTRLLRAGATLSVGFLSRNVIRDQFTAAIYSKYGYIPFWDWGKGMFSLLKKDSLYQEFKAAGGEQTFLTSLDRQSINIRAKELTGRGLTAKEKTWKIVKSPIEALAIVSEYFEKGTRLGLYAKSKQAGLTSLEAVAEARDGTLDFKRIGQERFLNQLIAFWNANVQGTDKLIRVLNFKKNPKEAGLVATKALLGITLPSIILWSFNKDDERYKALPEWQKNFFWILPLGNDGPIIRIPKPFDLGLIFGSLPERILDYIYLNDKKSINSVFDAIKQGAMPGLIPTAALPAIEQITNYSFFRQRQLESQAIKARPKQLRYTPFTSELAKDVGKLTNISPIMLENWVKGWGGTLGGSALKLFDPLLKDQNIPVVGKNWYEVTPVVRNFIATDPFTGFSQHVNDFYDNIQKISEVSSGYKLLKRERPREAVGYLKDNLKNIRLDKYARKKVREIAKLRRRQYDIMANKNINSKEKRRQIDRLGRRIVRIAQNSNKFIKGD